MSSAGVAISVLRQDSIVSPNLVQHQSCLPPDESILIYVACSGSLIPMRVLEYDSIESVKLRIQSFKGFVAKKQKLVCGGRELSRNNSLVKDYGIADGNVLHLVLRLSDLQAINVRTVSGKEFTFHVERSRDVGYVKRQAAKKAGDLDNLDDQEVVCSGERLEDQRLIDDISKQKGAVIYLLVRKSAKLRARPVEKKNFELSIVASSESSSNRKTNEEVEGQPQQKKRQYDIRVVVEEEKKNCTQQRHEELFNGGRENCLLNLPPPGRRDLRLEPVIVNPKVELSSAMWDLMDSTLEGLECGYQPIRSAEGTGGAYFMQDAYGNCVSIFKPIDEEPMAVNNPHGLPLSADGEGLKKGTRVGEGALREVAAYLLDHPPKGGRRSLFGFGDEKGFAGVPPTVLVKCLHPGAFNHHATDVVKIGSLQMFMENQGSCEDMGPGAFPVEEVHKISVLDIRLANADRHAGNILLLSSKGDGGQRLVPIDHGYCLPESFEDCTFDWLYWPQSRQPYSRETIEYIKTLDAEEDIALLKYHGWDLPVRAARVLRISTMLLKKGVERGFTPLMIGNIVCRQTLNKKSLIEEMVEEAQDCVLPGTSEAAFLEALHQVMDSRLDQIP